MHYPHQHLRHYRSEALFLIVADATDSSFISLEYKATDTNWYQYKILLKVHMLVVGELQAQQTSLVGSTDHYG